MSLQSILVVPDTHRPYHDKRAWALMLKVAKALKPKMIVVMGDLADFYTVSAHSHDPRRSLQLEQEVADVNLALDELDALGAPTKYFIEGNHEDRLRRYLQDKAPELFGLTNTAKLFELAKRGWHFTPYKDHVKIGKIHFTHDVGNSGRNASFQALEVFQQSVVIGHTHRLQYLVEGTATGEYKLSAQFGWLGDVNQIEYMSKAKARKNWALGFGVGSFDSTTGFMYLTPVPLVKYTCVVNGRLFKG